MNYNYHIFDEKQINPLMKINFGEDFSVKRATAFGIENRETSNVIFDESLSNKTVVIDIENCAITHFNAVFLKAVENAKLIINVGKKSAISLVFCEISHLNIELDIEINLLANESRAEVNIASIGLEDSTKNYDIKVNHLAQFTKSNVILRGISNDRSLIRFLPHSKIAPKTVGCEVYQDNRIINLKDESRGIIKPMLMINNNEVKAKHSAVLGNVKDEEIFYLLSRGIEEPEARLLIIKGLVKPTLDLYPDFEEKEKFKIVLERGITRA